jgi:exonuclease III
MAGITTCLSILKLNVNGLNSPIKMYYLQDCIKKEDPKFFCLQENHLTDRTKQWLRVKGWKKIYQANGPKKTGRRSDIYIRQSGLETYNS